MKSGYVLIPALFVLLITLIVTSCNKSGSSTKPKLSLESITTTVEPNGEMDAKFKFSKGSSLGNGMFGSIRIRLNQLPPTNPSGGDTILTPIPDFSAQSGEFTLDLPWSGYLSETAGQNDTVIFKFFVLTVDTLSSDTIKSPQIVILNP
jgi:hypothetical protein